MRQVRYDWGGRIVVLLTAGTLVLSGCGGKPRAIEDKCGTCHSTVVVYKAKHSSDEWDQVLFGMKARGLKVSPEEEREIMDILRKKYSRK